MTAKSTIVLGAGISGLVAAHEIARRGLRPTVLEAAPFSGGRTSTWTDARGRVVDTGLHVVADHYANFIEVLSGLGASQHLRWVEKHTYLRAGRPPLEWYFAPRRPPFHLTRPFFEMPVSWRTRLRLGRTGLTLASYDQHDLAELDDLTYLDWHRRKGLGDDFVLELAEAAADAATFLTVEEAAARPVLSWIKYMMRTKRAGDVGLFQGTLEDCLVRPLVRSIESHGGRVLTHKSAVGLRVNGRTISAVGVARSLAQGPCHRADGQIDHDEQSTEWIKCDQLISALPVQALRNVLGPDLSRDAGLEGIARLTTTPAISLIAWFDREIEPAPDGAPLVTGCAMRDFVDLNALGRKPAGSPGSVYQFVVTRASSRFDDPDEAIVRDVIGDFKTVWAPARDAIVVDYALERIGAAMFAAVPGAHALRPGNSTRLGNFFLAGDWTRHELNASMEGAALSGRLAANAVLHSLGLPLVPIRRAPDPTVSTPLRRLRRPIAAVNQMWR